MFFMEFDLAGAEWVVTAYLANDAKMIEVANGTESPHIVTGSLISGAPVELVHKDNKLCAHHTDPNTLMQLRKPIEEQLAPFFIPRTMSIRQAGKKSNHGLNYRMRHRRFALENEMSETDAKPIVEFYSTKAYPGLRTTFWRDVDEQMKKNRTLINCFGRKRRFLDQWGPDLLMAATAYLPQSTVFDVCRTGMIEAYRAEDPYAEQAWLLAQVHDSLLNQFPDKDIEAAARFAVAMSTKYMAVPLRYNNHEFTLRIDAKIGWNWGQEGMQEVKLSPDVDAVKLAFQEALDLSASK